MSMFRVALLTTAVVFVLPPSQARADDSIEVQYLGGTVKTIPSDTLGSLNLSDANELRFHYGTSEYRLPYTQITGTEVTEPTSKGHWLLHMPLKKRFETLVVGYKDSNGVDNTLNFKVNARLGEAAQEAITSRRHAAEALNADPNSYWGDKYWKTARNHAQFEPKTASGAVALGTAGTK